MLICCWTVLADAVATRAFWVRTVVGQVVVGVGREVGVVVDVVVVEAVVVVVVVVVVVEVVVVGSAVVASLKYFSRSSLVCLRRSGFGTACCCLRREFLSWICASCLASGFLKYLSLLLLELRRLKRSFS